VRNGTNRLTDTDPQSGPARSQSVQFIVLRYAFLSGFQYLSNKSGELRRFKDFPSFLDSGPLFCMLAETHRLAAIDLIEAEFWMDFKNTLFKCCRAKGLCLTNFGKEAMALL
jgi:hypothetical protein